MINVLALSSPITVVFAIFFLCMNPLNQNFQRKMLHVRKVQNIFFPLLLSIHTDKFPGKLHQHFHRLPAAFQKKRQFLFTHSKIPASQILQNILLVFPKCLYLFLQKVIHRFLRFLRRQSCKSRTAKDRSCSIKIPCQGFFLCIPYQKQVT